MSFILSRINNDIDENYYGKYKSIQELISSSLGEEKYLYKYIGLNENIEFVEKIIKDKTIKFSDPTTFNDPFECMSIIGVLNYSDIRDKLHEEYLKQGKSFSEEIVKVHYDDLIHSMIDEFHKNNLSKYGILSLSSVWNNILMWSHYASQHKGIVLIFKYIPSNDFYEKMMKVRYKNGIEFFELSHSNKDKKIWESFSTKHTMWEYENEYRIISPPSAPHMFDGAKIKPFPKELLFGIIFGIKTLNQHKVDINKWVSRYYPQLRIFQAKAKVDDVGIEKVCLERQVGSPIEEKVKSKRKQRIAQTKKRKSLFAVILAIATILGTAITVLSLLPRVIVDSSVPVDPSNTFSASFTITSASLVPLEDINVYIGIGQVVIEPAQINPNFIPDFTSRLFRPEWMHHRLSVDDRFTITIGDIFGLGFGTRLSGADIAIVVSYKPWILPLRREKVFRFVTKRQTDGRLYWYSRPLQ